MTFCVVRTLNTKQVSFIFAKFCLKHLVDCFYEISKHGERRKLLSEKVNKKV